MKHSLKAKYGKFSNIPRVISSEREPITEACINLRIVTRESVQGKEKDFCSQNAGEGLRDQKVRGYAPLYEESLVELEEAIDIERVFEGGDTKVVIYGRAGVGKSTLCRLLAVKWQEDRLWGDKFGAVIWLPLRELIAHPVSDDIKLYFSHIVISKCMAGFELPSVEETCEYLFSPQNHGKILIILDGYDEIVHSSSPQLQKLLSAILSDPHYHVILTSRPIAITLGDEPVKFDQELESVGFSKEDINNYIQKFYPDSKGELIQFIESNKHIRNIAHIPLNLELICSVYSPATRAQEDYTATRVYAEITEQLFKRMAKKGVFACSDARKKELIELLGKIALVGMKNNCSIISSAELHSITNYDRLFEILLAVGIIKTISVNKNERDNPVYFIHHTFAEYFAAVSIAHGFEGYIEDAEYKTSVSVLREHKYRPYYEVIWTSVVGSLYASCNLSENYLPLFQFWDAFENEPRELLGITHDTLRFKLLEECPPLKNPPAALQNLRNALIDTTQVIDRLFKVIESNAIPNIRLYAIEAIVSLDARIEEVISKLKKVMKEDDEECVRMYAAEALLRLGCSSEEALDIMCSGPKYLNEYKLAGLRRVYETHCVDLKIKETIANMHLELPQYRDVIALALVKPPEKELIDVFKDKTEVGVRSGFGSSAALLAVLGVLDATGANLGAGPIVALCMCIGGVSGAKSDKALGTLGLMGALGLGMSVLNLGLGPVASVAIGLTSASGIGGVLFSGISVAGENIYNYLFASISAELDALALSDDKYKFQKICERTNNNLKTIMAWSTEGVLNLSMAICIYSQSNHVAWLEPMKEITFIYKDPNIFLTIHNKLIIGKAGPLTKNGVESRAVLMAVKEAYKKADFPTKLMDHYLSGITLDVSTEKEKFALACRTRSARPVGLTVLHRAAASGNVELVMEMLQDREIDINHFDNDNCDTPLTLAIRGGHWEVVRCLLKSGADVNVSGAVLLAIDKNVDYEILTEMIKKSCFLNEGLLRKMLAYSVADYKCQRTEEAAEKVLSKLCVWVTGKDRRLIAISKEADRYRMQLYNAGMIKRDCVGEIEQKGAYTDMALRIRLNLYLELYMRLATEERPNLPSISGKKLTLEETLERLYLEIKIINETFINAVILANLKDEVISRLKVSYAQEIISRVLSLEVGQEYVISSASRGPGHSHCMYIALCKFSKDRLVIRVDNRWLTSDSVDTKKHGSEPYKIRVLEKVDGKVNSVPKTKIKSYCVGMLDLMNEQEDIPFLKHYISFLFTSESYYLKFPYVYGGNFSSRITSASYCEEDVKQYIDTWPYHSIQECGTDNCTSSSYNLGISIRHGMEFFEWLIGREQKILPPISSVNTYSHTVFRHVTGHSIIERVASIVTANGDLNINTI